MTGSLLTLKDAERYRELLHKQFSTIIETKNVSSEEAWQMFLNQRCCADNIDKKHLPLIKSILNGNLNIPLKDWREIVVENIEKFKYCKIIPVLVSISDGGLIPDLSNHYLKMAANILSEEMIDTPFTINYRDETHTLREFCTYARSTIDARLQAVECIQCVADNPTCIQNIIQVQRHTDSFDW